MYILKHKKYPCQFEWEGTKETFDMVISNLTLELKEHGLNHFDMFEEITEHPSQVEGFIESMTPPTTKTPKKPKTPKKTHDEVQE